MYCFHLFLFLFFFFHLLKEFLPGGGGCFFLSLLFPEITGDFFPQFLTLVFPFLGVVFYPEKFFPHPSQRISIARKAGKKFLNKCSHCFDFEDDGKKEVNMFPIYGKNLQLGK